MEFRTNKYFLIVPLLADGEEGAPIKDEESTNILFIIADCFPKLTYYLLLLTASLKNSDRQPNPIHERKGGPPTN